MPLDYAALLGIATSHIELMGREAILRAIDGTTQIPVTALISDVGAPEREGALISRGEKRAYIAAKPGVAPDPELHRLLLDGKSYRIVSVNPNKPAGTVLYYDCELRL